MAVGGGPVLGQTFGNLFQGVSLGEAAGVANAITGLRNSKAKLKADQARLETDNLNSAFSILTNLNKIPGAMRRTGMQALQRSFANAGITADETALNEFLGNKDAMAKMVSLINRSQTEQDPQKAQQLKAQAGGILDSLTTPDEAIKAIADLGIVGDAGDDSALDVAKFSQTFSKNIQAETKVPNKVITEANKLMELSRDQASGFAGTAAISVFARLIDPDSSVRVQEAANIAAIGAGTISDIRKLGEKIAAGTALNATEWSLMRRATAAIVKIEQVRLDNVISGARAQTTRLGGRFDIESEVLSKLSQQSPALQKEIENLEKFQAAGGSKAGQAKTKQTRRISASDRQRVQRAIQNMEGRAGKKLSPAQKASVRIRILGR